MSSSGGVKFFVVSNCLPLDTMGIVCMYLGCRVGTYIETLTHIYIVAADKSLLSLAKKKHSKDS